MSTGRNDVEFHNIGGSGIGGGGGGGSILSSGGLVEQWRLQQQFPFLANLETPTGLYQFDGENAEPEPGYAGQIRSKPLDSSSAAVTGELGGGGGVKMEENQGLNMSRNFLGALGNDQYWAAGNAWSANDLSGFTSSSTTHNLL